MPAEAPLREEEVVADAEGAGDRGQPSPRRMPQYRASGEPAAAPRSKQKPPDDELRPDSFATSPDESRDGSSQRRTDDPAFTNVFLNVGRRDGLHVEDIQLLLVEKAGLAESDVGHIRLRDRITFVGIRKEHSEHAIKALAGAVVGDRTVNAEPARDR
jgi:ATP-dependent RNA helicase DeaD